MEKRLFFLLNLHLLNEKQLFGLLCIITLINMLIGLGYLWYKWYFVELYDVFVLGIGIVQFAYCLFLVEHITFFASLFYLHMLLLIFLRIVKMYSYKIE